MRSDPELIRAYLLGTLSDADRAIVEARLFAEEEFVDRLEFAEDELVDAYVRHELVAQERASFERHFMAAPHRRQLTQVANSMARISPPSEAAPAERTTTTYLTRFWQAGGAFAPAFATVALVALVGTVAWLGLVLRDERRKTTGREVAWSQERTASQTEIDRLNRELSRRNSSSQADAPAIEPSAIAAIYLTPGLFRNADARRVTIPVQATSVRLHLQTDITLPPGAQVVVLRRESGEELWRTRWVTPNSNVGGIDVLVPAGLLSAGPYVIEWRHEDTAGQTRPVEDYSLLVDRSR